MGLFGGGNSSNQTVNEDNRTIVDYSDSDFSQQNDFSNETEIDGSISGNNANNTGTINIVDGGAFSLAGDALEFSSGVFSDGAAVLGDVAQFADNQSARTLDAAINLNDAGAEQLSLGTDLALGLAKLNVDASVEQQADNNNALENGFKSAMQFVEGFSRSDGTALASTNMKTIAIISGFGLVGLFIFKAYK